MSTVGRMDYVRAFGQAAEEVMISVLQETPERGQPCFQLDVAIPMQELNLVIGLTGDPRGQVSYGMELQTAKEIARIMMNADEVPDLKEMEISALGELANMVSGRALMILSERGTHSDITPPSIIQGNAIAGSWYGIRAMSIPIVLSFGAIHLVVGLAPGNQHTSPLTRLSSKLEDPFNKP